MAPHLLSLPLELRHIIYAYLHKEINIETWAWATTNPAAFAFYWADVQLHNAPVCNMLLVCSQLHDEYSQADCFKALSATIYLDLTNNDSFDYPDMRIDHRVKTVLPHVRHISIMAEFDAATIDFAEPFWQEVKRFVAVLEANTQNMESLILIPRLPSLKLRPYEEVRQHSFFQEYAAESRAWFLPSPPPKLAGLPLTLRGEGCQIGLGACFPSHEQPFIYDPYEFCDRIRIVPGHTHTVFHNTTWVGSYTYGSHARSKPLHVQQTIIQHWQMFRYPKEVLDILSESLGENVSKEVVHWPEQIHGWKEKSDNEAESGE
jgi:hypothetical protein